VLERLLEMAVEAGIVVQAVHVPEGFHLYIKSGDEDKLQEILNRLDEELFSD
jgi:hypothetical protein